MEKKVRILGKLFLIFLCTVCFIWLIAKDQERISLKQPEGESISRQEVIILMQAFAEEGSRKGTLKEETKSELDKWIQRQKEKTSQPEQDREQEEPGQIFLYEDYIELTSILQQEDDLNESMRPKQEPDINTESDFETALKFDTKYQTDFYLLEKDWYQAYDFLLSSYGLTEEIKRKQINILAGNSSLTEEKLGESCLLTDAGKIYRYQSKQFENCFFTAVTAYVHGDMLLTVLEQSDEMFTLKNVWIMEKEEAEVRFFYQGFEISSILKEELKDPLRETVADITFGSGGILRMKMKKERVNGKLLSIGEAELELEGRGLYKIAEDFKVYQLYEDLREVGKDELRIGYDFADFVLEDGEICAALIMQKENMESIRVAVKTNDFASLYHEEIRLLADCETELSYGAYENRQTEIISEGKEIIIKKGSDYLKGDRIVLTPSVHSGKIKVLSLNRNQGIPSYRGRMEIAETKKGLVLINEVLLEEYLYSVVPSEMPASYPKEALKAQAVCARTYAYRYLLSPGIPSLGANVDDSVGYQVYNNIAENVESTKAVKETTGELLYYRDAPVSTYYYSTSCGFGTDAGVWKESNKESLPYLRANHIAESSVQVNAEKMTQEEYFREYILQVSEGDFEKKEPWYRWQYEVPKIDTELMSERVKDRFKADSSKILTFTGKKWENRDAYIVKKIKAFSEIYDIKCLKRREGGVVDELLLVTDEGTYKIISEYNIRYILNQGGSIVRQDGSKIENGQLLPSAYMVIDAVKKDENMVGYTIFGGGYGHGVGLSQNGARAMGNAGMKCEEIAAFFYPGCQIEKLY